MIYHIDRQGNERPDEHVLKAMEAYKAGGYEAMHDYLQQAAEAGEISKADAFYDEIHSMSYLW